jgi:hypothetical protein
MSTNSDNTNKVSYRLVPVILLLLGVIILSAPFVPSGIDWDTVLRPATVSFLHLENPYQIEGVFNPPWLFVLLAPFAVLPSRVGGVILLWLNLITWVVVSARLGAGNLGKVIAVLTFPIVVNGLLARNVDFMVMWGLLMSPEFGVFFFAIKPQVGGAVLLYIAMRAYREGGWRRLIRIFAAPGVLILLSLVAYGLWPLNAGDAIGLSWNASPIKILGWPAILIGVALFGLAARQQDSGAGTNISMAASPFFSPYVGSQSWVAILPALIGSRALYVVWLIVWAWVAYRTMIQIP